MARRIIELPPSLDDVVGYAAFSSDKWGHPAVVFRDPGTGEYFFTRQDEWDPGMYPGMEYIQTVSTE